MVASLDRYLSANEVISRAAALVGLDPVADPLASSDKHFVQLRYLLDDVGMSLLTAKTWQRMVREHSFTTTALDTGVYDLPDDFSHMIDQTGWDHTNNAPLGGPLSSQDWTYLAGRDMSGSSIFASFRIDQGQLWIFPQPPPVGVEIHFEYMSRGWLQDGSDSTIYHDKIQTGTDLVLYEPVLAIRALRYAFLSAKGFDTTAASNDLNGMLDAWKGKDAGSAILNAGGRRSAFPYLDIRRNVADTGYGT